MVTLVLAGSPLVTIWDSCVSAPGKPSTQVQFTACFPPTAAAPLPAVALASAPAPEAMATMPPSTQAEAWPSARRAAPSTARSTAMPSARPMPGGGARSGPVYSGVWDKLKKDSTFPFIPFGNRNPLDAFGSPPLSLQKGALGLGPFSRKGKLPPRLEGPQRPPPTGRMSSTPRAHAA